MATLTGLVSCYPVVPYEGGPTKKAPATTARQQAQAKKKAAVAAAKKKTAQATSGDTATGDLGLPSGTTEVDKTSPPVLPTVPDIVKPKVIKYAAMVPGKEGFVFNPYTSNQVDVRGIPSGTKVRDPHDANPAHIFRVP